MADILIKNMEMPENCADCQLATVGSFSTFCPLKKCSIKKGYSFKDCPLIPIPEHNDLADKSVIIERMGDAQDELWDKVDEKALSECHVAFLKAVMYAPTVLEGNE